MLTALRELSINDRAYQRGDEVDTRDLPQRRVNQLKRYGMVKEYDDAETIAVLLDRIVALEARVAVLEGQGHASAGGPPPAAVTLPSSESLKIKRGGAKTQED